MLAKRPGSAFEMSAINYVHIWFREHFYVGREWKSGGDGKLRYFDNIRTNVCCCFLSLILKSAAKKLNLTLELSEFEIGNKNSILGDCFGNNVNIFRKFLSFFKIKFYFNFLIKYNFLYNYLI